MSSVFNRSNFPDKELLQAASSFGTPAYLYSQKVLEETASEALRFSAPYGLTVRYAMKALPSAAILRIFTAKGLGIDASSGYEVLRAERAGIPSRNITLTAQELPEFFTELIERGVSFNACSLHQLESFGTHFNGRSVGVRFNPGLGSGHANRVNTGGPASSFGIWHEHVAEVKRLAGKHSLTVERIHSHIGAGTDPEVWVHCARLTLAMAAQFETATTVSLGGGFKVARMPDETPADLRKIGSAVKEEIEKFESSYGRKLHLEIEPGTYLTANAGVVISKIIDISDTGSNGYKFLKVDAGMTEVLRPSLYGAQHPMWSVPLGGSAQGGGDYLVVGHCCESGDILTPAPSNPEGLLPRRFSQPAIGDLLIIGACGAYCAGMPAKNYNSFPEAPELLLESSGGIRMIRKRQTLDQMLQNEQCSPN
ncbi:MAG: diaminopimelate decarboxylase [Deltaproteobacteria bacterium]|nr:diaminopimelate decarboxylase [Deltaproteobacteria bacterium]